jgi:hypothetical protein
MEYYSWAFVNPIKVTPLLYLNYKELNVVGCLNPKAGQVPDMLTIGRKP